MATTTITGLMRDFGLQTLGSYAPTITFTPNGAAVLGSLLLPTQPIVVSIAPDDSFSVDLQPTDVLIPLEDTLRGPLGYTMRAEWLNPGGAYTHIDISGLLFVPTSTVPLKIADLRQIAPGSMTVWYSETEPVPWPVGMVWVNSITGDMYRKVA